MIIDLNKTAMTSGGLKMVGFCRTCKMSQSLDPPPPFLAEIIYKKYQKVHKCQQQKIQTKWSPKLKGHQNKNFIKTNISPKLKCQQN